MLQGWRATWSYLVILVFVCWNAALQLPKIGASSVGTACTLRIHGIRALQVLGLDTTSHLQSDWSSIHCFHHKVLTITKHSNNLWTMGDCWRLLTWTMSAAHSWLSFASFDQAHASHGFITLYSRHPAFWPTSGLALSGTPHGLR